MQNQLRQEKVGTFSDKDYNTVDCVSSAVVIYGLTEVDKDAKELCCCSYDTLCSIHTSAVVAATFLLESFENTIVVL